MAAYYNENDPFAAEWLRQLINNNLIAPGDVDERSIAEVRPRDLDGYEQCHFFAGIGGWSYALRLAGWPDDRPVWTGSCPCQPFSAAGKNKGFADPRHLWPKWERLIRFCRPVTVFGEQVDKALAWLDLVSGALEGQGYSVGAAIVGAHSVGAPHRRQRIYWVAESDESGHSMLQRECDQGILRERNICGAQSGLECRLEDGGVADSPVPRRPRAGQHDGRLPLVPARPAEHGDVDQSASKGLALGPRGTLPRGEARSLAERPSDLDPWRAAKWIPCRDGKSRPVEPGTFPLAHGIPARVGRLRGYGNAIVPQVAAEFIQAYQEVINDHS